MKKLVKIGVIVSAMMALSSCSDALMCELGSRTACIDYAR